MMFESVPFIHLHASNYLLQYLQVFQWHQVPKGHTTNVEQYVCAKIPE